MNITQTSLEALVLKATHESLPCPDAAALEAFCAVMRSTAEGPQLAAQALANRIHSPITREALLALAMVDRCMRRTDTNFIAEVGKFRFLNEMIKLVSPKYYANKTASDVKTRILQLFHAWSIEFPNEPKFKVAYDMLKNQGVVKETPPPLPPEGIVPTLRSRARSVIYEDKERSKLLQKLLRSKKPEDLQHANRLIKVMVREEEKRIEENCRRAQEACAALQNASVLRDMLENAIDPTPDEEQLIGELRTSCARLHSVLLRMAASDTHTSHLNDIVHAIDVLDEVFHIYNIYMNERKAKAKPNTEEAQASNRDTLLDFAGANITTSSGDAPKITAVNNKAIDELGDIFSTEGGAASIDEPLKPVNLMTEDVDLSGENSKTSEGWNELDSLGEQLLKQSLPENAKRIDSFSSKSAKKIPMNALASPKHEAADSLNKDAILDLDFFTKKPEEAKLPSPSHSDKQTTPDDMMVDISIDEPNTSLVNSNTNEPLDNILELGLTLDENTKPETETEQKTTVAKKKGRKSDVKSLLGINVSLDSVQPSRIPPLTVLDEVGGVTVVLHFCKDKPRSDVNIIVVSTTSKHFLPIDDFKFQGLVPKGCKVRLLTPSGTSLPAFNPFTPPPAITQVMLIARPKPSPPLDLKFVVSYTCDDDVYSEMGEEKDLPLDYV